MMNPRILLTAGLSAALLACDGGSDAAARTAAAPPEATTTPAPVCRVIDSGSPLPEEVRESSGLAQSRLDPNVFWTHNDAGNAADIFAIGVDGALLGRVTVQGAESVDWEDVEAGDCSGGSCLYVGDIGDNDAERESITIYEIPEPEVGAARTAEARALTARFPDGPRDAESLFVLPDGDLYVVTKGREGAVALYQYPAPHQPGTMVTLRHIRELAPEPQDNDDRVTSATASPDGRWVGIRTYRTLLLYPAGELVGTGPVKPTRIDLSHLNEEQGEALVIENDGTIWLSSEAENKREAPRWARLKCDLSGAAE